ncbi:hypothetical protein [Vibrio parahaemolyticus]|uniref:hypothetical protein n=1 Tax=Vibrio parahaemolyticus TaxID=670 RepID=UPI00215B81A5|nr:hypothetical protein [Vibrio parahaemolyticus]EJB8506519.1 hypothetical protein [Vibrio parahaemolyticus]MCR9867688.1 hypothetical protein [Vibrio parahaemolyticus]
MAKIDSDVLIKAESTIPIELVQSSKDFMDIMFSNIPFLVTICVVVCAATVTYRSNRKSVESQNRLSQATLEKQTILANEAKDAEHQNKISEFRHQWIQEVRGTSSELSKVLHRCKVYYTLKQREFEHSVHMSGTPSGNQNHPDACDKYESKYIESRAEFYQLYSKIVLLFKPSDSQTENLLILLNQMRLALYNNPSQVTDESIDAILTELQNILKTEWEVTKSRTWVQNT